MKLLVVSDVHRNDLALDDIIKSNPGVIDILGLGDFEMEEFKLNMFNIITPMGNNDFFNGPLEIYREYSNIKIMLTHGHRLGVSNGYDLLLHKAKMNGVKIAMFGHNHHATILKKDGIILFNPGSTTYPDNGISTYGLIEINNNIATFYIKEVYTNEIIKKAEYRIDE